MFFFEEALYFEVALDEGSPDDLDEELVMADDGLFTST